MLWMIHLPRFFLHQDLGRSEDDKLWEKWVERNGGTIVFGSRIERTVIGRGQQETTTNDQHMWDDGDGGAFEDDEKEWANDDKADADEEDICDEVRGDDDYDPSNYSA
ncbi:hypothetical protein ACA910_013236 [Epithemia clementina (nom. ined.)]